MKKRGVKTGHLTASISQEVLKKFNEYCEKNSINKSDKIEKLIIRFLEEEK